MDSNKLIKKGHYKCKYCEYEGLNINQKELTCINPIDNEKELIKCLCERCEKEQ